MAPLISAHALVALALLAGQRSLLEHLGRAHPTARAQLLARILGVRHLLEAGALARRQSGGWVYATVAVDATHAATMLALARISPRYRRTAIVSAALELILCAYGLGNAGMLASGKRRLRR